MIRIPGFCVLDLPVVPAGCEGQAATSSASPATPTRADCLACHGEAAMDGKILLHQHQEEEQGIDSATPGNYRGGGDATTQLTE